MDVLLAAGNRLVELFQEGTRPEEKGGGHLVTVADLEIEDRLAEVVRNLYPTIGIFSQESGTLVSGKDRWIIDPLDGTTNFVFGIPHFAISMAREAAGRVVEAYVYNPISSDLYQAQSDAAGSYLNGEPIEVSRTQELGKALVALRFIANYCADYRLPAMRAVSPRPSGPIE